MGLGNLDGESNRPGPRYPHDRYGVNGATILLFIFLGGVILRLLKSIFGWE